MNTAIARCSPKPSLDNGVVPSAPPGINKLLTSLQNALSFLTKSDSFGVACKRGGAAKFPGVIPVRIVR